MYNIFCYACFENDERTERQREQEKRHIRLKQRAGRTHKKKTWSFKMLSFARNGYSLFRNKSDSHLIISIIHKKKHCLQFDKMPKNKTPVLFGVDLAGKMFFWWLVLFCRFTIPSHPFSFVHTVYTRSYTLQFDYTFKLFWTVSFSTQISMTTTKSIVFFHTIWFAMVAGKHNSIRKQFIQ